MKRIIRLTESDLHRILKQSVMRILNEDGAMGGDAATPGATSASSDRVGAFDVPFGGVQRRKGYSPKGSKESKMTEVDVKPAMKRHDGQCGSISIPKHRVGESIKGRKNKVNEGWFKNAAMAGAIGAASMFGGQKANAQDVQPIKQDTVQVVNQQQNMTIDQLKKLFPRAYKDRNANKKVWIKNQVKYAAEMPNGKISLVGKIAASNGQNPWDAIVKRYCPQNDNIFQLGDFDIQ